MTLDDMFADFELYGFEDFDDSDKARLLNQAYLDIVTREPWPFMENVVQFTAPSGTSQITNQSFSGSPSDVGSVLSFTDITNDVVMTPERADVIEKNYRINDLTGSPEYYYFVNDNVWVYPFVSGDTVYRLYYLRVPEEITTSTDTSTLLIPSRHHSVIVYGALVKAYLVNDDPQSAAFQNMFEQRYQQMRNDVWMNQYDRTDRIHVVTDGYDWSY